MDIEPRYGLDGPGIESRWGERFSAPVQIGPGIQPASCKMGTGSLPQGREVAGAWRWTPNPTYSAEFKAELKRSYT